MVGQTDNCEIKIKLLIGQKDHAALRLVKQNTAAMVKFTGKSKLTTTHPLTSAVSLRPALSRVQKEGWKEKFH